MTIARLGNIDLHYRIDGDPDGPPVVFANSLGTDLRLWDPILPLLPAGLRIIRYDKRGHGLSACPEAPYSMRALVSDAGKLLDHLGVKDCLFVGLSIGGMIAQGLAATRPELVRTMVISNTAAKIGTIEMWQQRMDAVAQGGIAALADPILERWFSKPFRESDEIIAWRNMLIRQPAEGYIGCCAAIAETDLFESTVELRLPTLAIAGSEDGSTPPDLVRETGDMIPGSQFHLIRGAGHLPCVEAPEEYARVLTAFLEGTGHV